MNTPTIVTRAYTSQVVDIGQLTKDQLNALRKYVRRGMLIKTTCYHFPIPKTAYVANPNCKQAMQAYQYYRQWGHTPQSAWSTARSLITHAIG